jgi:hypothetical protein
VAREPWSSTTGGAFSGPQARTNVGPDALASAIRFSEPATAPGPACIAPRQPWRLWRFDGRRRS